MNMVDKENFDYKNALLQKIFNFNCFYCGKAHEPTNKSPYSFVCRVCFFRYEALRDLEENNLPEISQCFFEKCYFCQQMLVLRQIVSLESVRQLCAGKKIANVNVCVACKGKFETFKRLEQEKLELEIQLEK